MKATYKSLLLITLPLTTLGCLTFLSSVRAQITPDNSLGAESSVVTPNVEIRGTPSDRIDGGAIRGNNLFHSFSDFNVNSGRGAYFSNPSGIANILSRVTGSNNSNIGGTLGVLGNANLFFANPNGVIFGPNARLDVSGSFFASTADSFIFDNGFEFSASNPQAPPLLTVNIPVGLRFRENPGSITNTGNLAVGQDMTLSAGNLDLQGQLGAGKNLTLQATDTVKIRSFIGSQSFFETGQGGDIRINTRQLLVQDGSRVSTSTSGTGDAGNIIVNASESVQLTGVSATNSLDNSGLFASTEGAGKGGDIRINTEQLLVQDGSTVSTTTSGLGDAGNIIVNASESVQLTGPLNQSTLQAATVGGGRGGDITITTPTLLVRDSAGIVTLTQGAGKGGNLTVNASESVQVTGFSPKSGRFSSLSAQVSRRSDINPGPITGEAGNLTITTKRLLIKDGAQVAASNLSTAGTGGGNLTVNASESVKVIGTNPFGTTSGLFARTEGPGNAKNLTINTGQLTIADGAQVSASTRGSGNAGDLIVNASESVQVIGTSADGESNSSLSVQSNRRTTGDAGNLAITTGQLLVRDGGQVSAATLGSGRGGSVNITSGQLLVQDGGQVIAATLSSGSGGRVTVNASESVQLIGRNSILTSQTQWEGNAGDVAINTGQLLLQDGGQVNALTLSSGRGGRVTVNASESVQLIGRNSILTSQTQGEGEAGDVKITTEQLIMGDEAEISTTSFSSGNAGNIQVQANSLDIKNSAGLFSNSLINSEAGNIEVTTSKDIRLDQGASINANTTGGQGNITLQPRDLIMRRNSSITTNARGEATGGNITIDTDNLVALENSDISANAEESFGGRVKITAQGIFGTQFRDRLTSKSDITATSELGPQFNGLVETEITAPDPTSGLIELPENVVDPRQLIAQNPCQQGVGSEFVVTGRGGLPLSPAQTTRSETVRVDLVKPAPQQSRGNSQKERITSSSPATKQIVPAQGWIVKHNGEVVLTAHNPTNKITLRSRRTPGICSGR